jgi:hypothetical protein
MNAWGYPVGLFAANRWVTGETWYPADDVIAMLDRFHIDHAAPSWPVNRWISAMSILFRPHAEALLRHRDAMIVAWQAQHADTDVFEDRRLEITGYLPIDVSAWTAQLEKHPIPAATLATRKKSAAGRGRTPAAKSVRHGVDGGGA